MWLDRPARLVSHILPPLRLAATAPSSSMFKLDIFIELLADLLRAMIVDGFAERVRKLGAALRLRAVPRGMGAVRRHIHHRTRAKLLSKLSTKAS